MAEYSGYKDVTSSRHLRFKLQSLGRRLDELEEATKSLQKAEDELLDLQDKVIQAEGSNSGMLAEVEALRKRVLKIEGKDEEIKKAEDMCQLMKEKLEEQENLTQDLKAEIERLQKRMAELEELEEAFGRSKNDCTQLCLRLNEERNLTKKISSELETLRVKVKELETSEDRLGKTEQSLAAELEKLRSLTLSFVSERKYLNDRDRENEKLIKELTQKLEQNKVNLVDHPRNASTLLDRNDLRIEDGVSSTLPSKEARRKGMLDYRKQGENETRNKSENEKNRNQEDNKVKDLNQEIEKLKTQIKHYESLEEELKKMRAQNNDLKDSYQSEQNKNKLLASQLEEVKLQLKNQKDLENGEVENEESFLASKGRQHERPKYRGLVHESPTTKNKSRELSPQHKRGERARNKEHILSNDNTCQGGRQVGCSGSGNRRASKASSTMVGMDNTSQDVAKRPEDSFVAGSSLNEGKRVREQPSVLSRYPPAAQEHRILKGASKPGHENGLKGKVEKTSRVFNDASHGRGSDDRSSRMDTSTGNKVLRVNRAAALDASLEVVSAKKILNSSSGSQVSSGLAAELGTSKAMDPSASSRRSSSEGLSKCKRSANDQEADSSPPTLKPPVVSKTSYGSKSQEEVLPGFVAVSKGEQEPVSVMTEDSGHHEALRCRVIKPSGRERLDLEDDMDTDSLVTAKLVNTTITPESESKRQPRSRAALRTPLFDHDRDIGADPDPVKPGRNTATEFQDANNSGVKNRRPFSPREALRSKAVIKPIIIDKDLKEVMGGVGADSVSEKPKPPTSRSVPNKVTSCITIYPERHTSTSNIQVVPSETPSVTNHISLPFEISINKNEITRQITDADQAGDPPLKNRPETVVSRSSITIKPSEPSERNSQESPSENLRWKSHRSPLEMEPSDTKHVTVRSAWRTRRDLNSLEDPPSQGGKNVDLPNAYMQRSSTDFSELERPRPSLLEQGGRRGAGNPGDAPESSSRRTQSSLTVSEVLTRRGRAGDSVSAAALSRPAGLEEAEGSNLNSFRWQHNCLERPELPAKRPPELTRVRAEERVRRVKHSSEEN